MAGKFNQDLAAFRRAIVSLSGFMAFLAWGTSMEDCLRVDPPAGEPRQPATQTNRSAKRRAQILDGKNALEELVRRAGWKSLLGAAA